VEQTIMTKLANALIDPQVATPVWGALGGLISALIQRRRTIFSVVASMVLASLFAHWFTDATVTYFELPVSAHGGIGAILGIGSYEMTKLVATGEIFKLSKKLKL